MAGLPPPARQRLSWAILGITALLFTMATAQNGPSIPIKYCAKVNTGNTFKAIVSDFQSEGRCDQNCTSYAFAIVREKACWCSNLIPNEADLKSIGDCSVPCPGYPTDLCGGIGLWGYLQNNGNEPKGTAPAGYGISTTAAPTTTKSTSSSRESSTVTTTSSSSSTSDFSSTTSSLPDTTKEPRLTTITLEGTVKTVTITPSQTGNPNDAGLQNDSRKGLQSGAIAGIVVGVVAGLILLAIIVWLLWRKRRETTNSEIGFAGPSRRVGSATGSITALESVKSGHHVSAARYLKRDPDWEEEQERKRRSVLSTDPRMKPVSRYRSYDSLTDARDYSRTIIGPSTRVLRVTNASHDD
ncbi:hypothetical protein QBC43DRAFT_67962 [Cladorrhinum sp. PSN259]|nr:hypothetical protein QBC43DRAFT_67962 [Cladorrhinum sp. PSN259]